MICSMRILGVLLEAWDLRHNQTNAGTPFRHTTFETGDELLPIAADQGWLPCESRS